MLLYSRGSENDEISSQELKEGIVTALKQISHSKVLVVPPDITRLHSRAGELTRYAWEYLGSSLTDILPALGTHYPMTDSEILKMFGNIPKHLFREHNWRSDIITIGTVPGEYVSKQSNGFVDFDWPAQVNKMIVDGGHDLILSIGQVVPHEVIGMANYNKNLFVGTGGVEGINKSHFLGAVYGMEKIMGRAYNPVRNVLNYAEEHFASDFPILYVQTVIGTNESGELVTRGLFIGDDIECFEKASELSLKVNFTMIEKPLKKVVVYLDPSEFKSTWLGNKSVYRTRMALADGAELIVIAPGVAEFGEDKTIDSLIRKYGYVGTEKVLDLVKKNDDLSNSLGAAAHLIHGSSEERFTIRYCPGGLSKEEIESVNFEYGDIKEYTGKYNPEKLIDGMNIVDGEEIFFISNPALGLWTVKNRFNS